MTDKTAMIASAKKLTDTMDALAIHYQVSGRHGAYQRVREARILIGADPEVAADLLAALEGGAK